MHHEIDLTDIYEESRIEIVIISFRILNLETTKNTHARIKSINFGSIFSYFPHHLIKVRDTYLLKNLIMCIGSFRIHALPDRSQLFLYLLKFLKKISIFMNLSINRQSKTKIKPSPRTSYVVLVCNYFAFSV